MVDIQYSISDFTIKTCAWLTHANVQTEGVHLELPLADRQIHRFMSSPVRCNLPRRSDEVYLRLFSHQTLFLLSGQLTSKEWTVPCCRSICWELPILGIRKSWLSSVLRQSKESSAWLNSWTGLSHAAATLQDNATAGRRLFSACFYYLGASTPLCSLAVICRASFMSRNMNIIRASHAGST